MTTLNRRTALALAAAVPAAASLPALGATAEMSELRRLIETRKAASASAEALSQSATLAPLIQAGAFSLLALAIKAAHAGLLG